MLWMVFTIGVARMTPATPIVACHHVFLAAATCIVAPPAVIHWIPPQPNQTAHMESATGRKCVKSVSKNALILSAAWKMSVGAPLPFQG